MDLLHSQIKKSCSLALPAGLKDLMSDISREVLRARPTNVPEFIADYLEVLLEVREKLSIACHAWNDTYKNVCEPALYKEFKSIGLSEEDIDVAINIVEEHLDRRNVKEQSLLIKLARKISIDEMQLPTIQNAIQKAFKQYYIKNDVLDCENKDNKVAGALHHTLDWHKQNRTTTEEVFIAPNFEPCGSIPSTPAEPDPKLPKYRTFSAHDRSENEKHASWNYTLQSVPAGKVKFMNENVFKKDEEDTETNNDEKKVYGDDIIDYSDDDDVADDKNEINDKEEFTDDDIEENIESIFQDESSSSVEEDFAGEGII